MNTKTLKVTKDQIDSLTVNLHPTIVHCNLVLAFVRDVSRLELDAHGIPVDRFEEARP